MGENKKFSVLLDENADQLNKINANSNNIPTSSVTEPDLKKWSFSSNEPENKSVDEEEKAIVPGLQHVNMKQLGADKYRCETLSLFKIDGIVVSKSSAMTDFTVAILEKDDRNTIAQITVQNTYLDNSIGELNNYNTLFKRIASVKDNMLLKIDNSGIITAVLNKDELEQKWLQIKSELQQDRLFNLFKPEDQKQILQGGDDEYVKNFDMVSFLNQSHTLYAMLFCGYWREYELQETYDLKPQLKISTLFRGQGIPLEVYGKIKRYNNDHNQYQLEIQAIEDRKFDTSKLKALYKENYPFAKVEFDDYSYDYSTNLEIETGTGWIKKLGMTVLEQAGSIVMFMDCTIKLLTDEESDITQ
jgi:hypothetical protein